MQETTAEDLNLQIDIYDEIGIGGGAFGISGGLLHPYSPKAKLLWRGAECWNECLKLLGIAEAAEASMDSDQLSSGISDFDTHFQGLIVQKSVKYMVVVDEWNALVHNGKLGE
ncbi:uncharacterized protein LOC133824613 [Humulus lupulus]|uniref:uncharacterized protein LOC133824613 n=1 Tax=Humulus lupulus TaxID=3486 RepID=UPI002B403F61|nr:uncharacterized protein LOC133824613 [Humulus lupulus]